MEQFKLTINRKIDRWDEAIPLGNGEMLPTQIMTKL